MDERSRYEHVKLPATAKVYALDSEGQRIGLVRDIGVGGLVIETARQFASGSPHHVFLVDENERIRRELIVVARSANADGVAFQLRALDLESAVEIGVIIGRYSVAARGATA